MHGNACNYAIQHKNECAYNACQSVLHSNVEAARVTARKIATILVGGRTDDTRTDSVDYRLDVTNVEGFREHSVAGRTPVESSASIVKLSARGSEDTATDAAATLQLRISGVDDRVHRHAGDILLHQYDPAGGG